MTAPRKQGAGVCVRDGYHVYLTPVAGVSQETLQKNVPVRADGISHTPSSQIALAEDCASVEHFTHLFAVPPDIGEGVLRFVAHLRDKARARMSLGVEVECRSELSPNPCDQDIPRIVANLPVHSAHSIRKSYLQGARWEVWLNETVLPSPYWAIHLDDAPGRARKATLIWQIPAPF